MKTLKVDVERGAAHWQLVSVVAVVLTTVLAVAGYLYSQFEQRAAQERAAAAEAAAQALATAVFGTLHDRLEGYRRMVAAASDLPGLLAARDRQGLKEREVALATAAPEILGVRLLALGVNEVDYGSVPPLTYASLAMIRHSEEKGKAPPPEAQLSGSDLRHIALLVRITDAENRLVGHALFGLEVPVVQSALDAAPLPEGYVEVREPVPGGKRVLVAKRGMEPTHKKAIEKRIGATGWVIRYIPVAAPVGPATLPVGTPLVWGGGGVLLALLAGAALLLARRRSPASRAADAAAAAGAEDVADALQEAEVAAAAKAKEGAGAPPSIFRAYDIRGIVGETLTPKIAKALGRAIGTEADVRNQQVICLGRDGRVSSPELAAALGEGLLESGREVLDLGEVATPVLYYATHYLETNSGVMVTGSHNPSQYNGVKIVLGGETLATNVITGLRARLESGELSTGMGVMQKMDVDTEYIRQVSEDIPVALGNPYKLVIDCANGVAGNLAPRLFRALGHDVVELYCDVDGHFPNHDPDPTQPENLRDLIARVLEEQADLGLAFDGDGDRLVVVDAGGNIIWPDRLMMLLARDILSRHPGAQIIYDVKSSAKLGLMIQELGGVPLMWKTGHSLLKGKLKETGAILAGEMSGHIFIADRWYGFDDALYAAARLLDILTEQPGTAAEVFAALPGGISTPELRMDMPEGEAHRFMERFCAATQIGGAEVTTIDGLRADYPDGWGLVRASNTIPSLVLRFEGDDEKALRRIQETFRQALLAVEPELSLPF